MSTLAGIVLTVSSSRPKGDTDLKDRIGSCVTSCLHISAVTWREQPPGQMASRPVV